MADMCKVGDTVYRLSKNGITKAKVVRIDHYPHAVYRFEGWTDICFDRAFGRTLFFTMEDANNAIRTRENIAKKREMLKRYETELNEKFGLENHKIVK